MNDSERGFSRTIDMVANRIAGKMAVGMKLIEEFSVSHKNFTIERCIDSESKYFVERNIDKAWMICEYTKPNVVFKCGTFQI